MLTDCCCRAIEPQSTSTDYAISFPNSGGQHQLEKRAEHEMFVLGPAAELVPISSCEGRKDGGVQETLITI